MRIRIMVLVLLICFSMVSIAFAATPTPMEVPKDHWAYAAIQALSKDGLIDGFQGDKTMTRYEMAQLVEKAITNSSKATAEQKYLIDKLGSEFALELNKIDVRVTMPEKKQSSLKLDGFFQYGYQYTKNTRLLSDMIGLASPGSATQGEATNTGETYSQLWLFIDNQFDGDTAFHGLLASESLGGRTTDAQVTFLEGNVIKKLGNSVEVGLGRFFPDLGFGTVGGAPFMDGVKLAFGTDVKFKLYSLKQGDIYGYPNRTFNMGDAKFKVVPNLLMSLAFKDDRSQGMSHFYDQKAVGLQYTGIPELVLDGEYTRNVADFAKAEDLGSVPSGYFLRIKYKGANPFALGSSGAWVEYKHADPGVDPIAFADPFSWNCPLNWSSPAEGGSADNIKGFEYGFETTVAKRTIFKMTYDKLTWIEASPYSLASTPNQSFFTASVTYLF